MSEAERSQTIRDAYNEKHGSKKEAYDKLNSGKPPGDPNRFSMADVRQWYLKNDIGTLKQQTGFNSYVPPTNDHEIQVDLFEYKYKQPKRYNIKNTEIRRGALQILVFPRPLMPTAF